MDKNSFDEQETLTLLKELSIQDFLDVGLHQVAYIKRINTGGDLSDIYSIHAADGSQISVMDSYDTAVAAIRVNDLFPVTVH
ncbi:MAG TPA: DUF1150 family protein [Alphaproteobacteria bacterium]|nr:DUF1150 family protein [Alphaproteobacteria bacterium]